MAFRAPINVCFSDIDNAGIVYYPRFMHYFHLAMEEFFKEELGIAYGAAGDISRSIEQLEKAVSLHPDPLAYLNLAVAMRKVGKLEDAVRYIKLYLENPEGESEESIARARAELDVFEPSRARRALQSLPEVLLFRDR